MMRDTLKPSPQELSIMRYLKFIPLFLFMLLIYDVMVFVNIDMKANLFSFGLISGDSWGPTWGDILLVLGIVVLYIELLKATDSGTATVVDHTLSVLVFIGFLIEFIAMKGAATSTFVILMLMSLLDVVAGFSITVSAARRDVGFHSQV
jgi:hypothetical protein